MAKLRHPLSRVEIGSNVISLDFALQRRLQRNHPLRRDSSAMQPHRDMGLTNTLSGNFTEPSRQGGLSTRLLDRLPQPFNAHRRDYNTDSVIDVNTRSVMGQRQTGRMPKAGKTTDFWRRLTLARTTCVPAKSMMQEDIAKDYGAAYQSTVTKWKTGGDEGSTKPRPEIVEEMALDTGVCFEWLYTGRGEIRPRPAPDELTMHIIDALSVLEPAGRVAVLKAAIAQQTLELPAVAARINEAERLAEAATRQKTKKKG